MNNRRLFKVVFYPYIGCSCDSCMYKSGKTVDDCRYSKPQESIISANTVRYAKQQASAKHPFSHGKKRSWLLNDHGEYVKWSQSNLIGAQVLFVIPIKEDDNG